MRRHGFDYPSGGIQIGAFVLVVTLLTAAAAVWGAR